MVHSNHINLIRANRACLLPSHTLFVDDIMVFCRGDTKSIQAINGLLKDYGSFSGQICNYSKSLVYAGGMSDARHSFLADIIGFKKAFIPFTYLGVPIFVGRPKAYYFNHIADNIKLKLANWKAKLLSMAGRVQLVKSTILNMLMHCLSVYNWPGTIIKKIEKWTRNFIWSGNSESKKLVTVKWKICCTN